jgi:hypothetical protein
MKCFALCVQEIARGAVIGARSTCIKLVPPEDISVGGKKKADKRRKLYMYKSDGRFEAVISVSAAGISSTER